MVRTYLSKFDLKVLTFEISVINMYLETVWGLGEIGIIRHLQCLVKGSIPLDSTKKVG